MIITEQDTQNMTDTEYELYQAAKDWFYESNHGYPEDIIGSLYELLISLNKE